MDISFTQKPGLSSLQNRWRLLLIVLVIAIIVSTLTYFILKDTLEKTTEHQALMLSEIVARQAISGRTVYSKYVVSKLKKDGFGADPHATEHRGFVPLPAQ